MYPYCTREKALSYLDQHTSHHWTDIHPMVAQAPMCVVSMYDSIEAFFQPESIVEPNYYIPTGQAFTHDVAHFVKEYLTTASGGILPFLPAMKINLASVEAHLPVYFIAAGYILSSIQLNGNLTIKPVNSHTPIAMSIDSFSLNSQLVFDKFISSLKVKLYKDGKLMVGSSMANSADMTATSVDISSDGTISAYFSTVKIDPITIGDMQISGNMGCTFKGKFYPGNPPAQSTTSTILRDVIEVIGVIILGVSLVYGVGEIAGMMSGGLLAWKGST